MVEVTFTPPRRHGREKSKMCWIPFKKQILDNRSLDISNTRKLKVDFQLISNNWDLNSECISNNFSTSRSGGARNEQQSDKKSNRSKRGGSVSTGTITDNSFLSEESRTTNGSTQSSSSKTHNSSSQSTFSQYSRCTSNFLYQPTNNTGNKPIPARIPVSTKNATATRSRPISSKRSPTLNSRVIKLHHDNHIFSNDNDNDGDSIIAKESNKDAISTTINRASQIRNESHMVKLAMVETNCMSKEFWTDEVVPGGAFACLQEQKNLERRLGGQRCIQLPKKEKVKVVKESETIKPVSFNFNARSFERRELLDSKNSIKDVILSTTSRTEKEQQQQQEQKTSNSVTFSFSPSSSSLHQTKENVVHSFGRTIQYLFQDPENDTNNEAPLRRVMCSSIPFRNRLLPQTFVREENDRQQEKSRPKPNPATYTRKENQPMNSNEVTRDDASDSVFKGKQQISSSRNNDVGGGKNTRLYVEVEALREQLKRIRNLENIRAQENKITEERVIARSSSLIDEDSVFFLDSIQGGDDSEKNSKDASPLPVLLKPSSNRDKSNGFIGDSDIIARKHHIKSNFFLVKNKLHDRQGSMSSLHGYARKRSNQTTGNISLSWSNRYKNDSEQNQNDPAFPEPVPRKIIDNNRSLQTESERKKMDRQSQLISEMVTDRILGMRMKNGIISDPMPQDKESYRKNGSRISSLSSLKASRSHEENFEESSKKRMNNNFTKSHSTRLVDSSSSKINPLNISDLTEPTYGKFKMNRNNGVIPYKRTKETVIRRSSYGNTINTDDDDKQNSWQESPLGYHGEEESPISHDSVATPVRDHHTKGSKYLPSSTNGPSVCEIYDEDFWKEDTDDLDLNTEAFETYGSEYDSLFGDILSSPDRPPKSSIDGLKQLQASKSRIKHDVQLSRPEQFRYTNMSHYTRIGDSSRYSRTIDADSTARKTYLQGDDFMCADQWSEGI